MIMFVYDNLLGKLKVLLKTWGGFEECTIKRVFLGIWGDFDEYRIK